MITSRTWAGKRYAVLGLARSGQATVRALLASGAEVVAWDANPARRHPSESWDPVKDGGTLPSGDPSFRWDDVGEIDLTGFTAVIVSPGVPLNRHPIAGHAARYGVPIIGDIELFAQARHLLPPHKVVGITGTNGKSTTTALVHHILKTAGVPTTMGGNIGLPILGQEPLPEGGVYVLELSSFQIDLTFNLDCDVAVLTNLSPDHLDRYSDVEAYYNAKRRLFKMQTARHFGIFLYDDEQTCQMLDGLDPPNECWTYAGQKLQMDSDHSPFQKDFSKSLDGPHNLANAILAITVAEELGISGDKISEALSTFVGLPHRMERIREKDGVLYVNDSKATNPTSTAPALAAYPVIHWILGGQAKTDELDACMPHIGHVKTAFTIGRDRAMLATLLRPHVPVSQSVTLDQAVWRASVTAKPGDTVLLSPACASFDQFRDYEDRGDQFRALVEAL